MEPPFDLAGDGDGVVFAVRVAPRAGKSAVAGLHDGALKIRIAAPPVEGAANEELIAFLARLLKVPKRDVTLVAGDASKNKRVRVKGIDPERVRSLL